MSGFKLEINKNKEHPFVRRTRDVQSLAPSHDNVSMGVVVT